MNIYPKPQALPVIAENIPEILRSIQSWVTWKYVWKEKWDKPPFTPDGLFLASHSNSATWGSFEDCLTTYQSGQVDGIGTVLHHEPVNDAGDYLVGIDLDNKERASNSPERNAEIEALHEKIIAQFDSYTERSPSGNGYRIFVLGKLPDRGRKNAKLNLEIYDNNRYLTVTGHKVSNSAVERRQEAIDAFLAEYFSASTPAPVQTPTAPVMTVADEQILATLKRDEKFQRLWSGDKSDYLDEQSKIDDSSAEMGFCNYVAGLTDDPAQIDRLFRQSGLMREKWEREQYRASTIDKAINFAATNRATKQTPARPVPECRIKVNELQREAKLTDSPPIKFLPLLGRSGFIVEGWSHIIAASPKVGKTELITRVLAEWQHKKILYVTEESQLTWKSRLFYLPDEYEHVSMIFALGKTPHEIQSLINAGDEDVVIIDTLRSVLSVQDEKDNSEMIRAMNPIISVCRERQRTLIFIHHDRKSGGDYGEAMAGAGAILGVVDVALEIKRMTEKNPRQRTIRGWGRIHEVPMLVYEKQEDGQMRAIGVPVSVGLDQVKHRAKELLSDEWTKVKDLLERYPDNPKPSDDQFRKALSELLKEGDAERDPPEDKPGITYKWRRRQDAQNVLSIIDWNNAISCQSNSAPQGVAAYA